MNFLIGVSGGIAAYKAADIVGALLKSKDVFVKVVMTENAKRFITPLTLATLSKGPVFDDSTEWQPDGIIKHIELSKWADVFVIVPATANTISKIATGITDNLLTSAYLAFLQNEKRVTICPAMNTHMWEKEWIQKHLEVLSIRSNHMIIPPEEGLLACGDYGMGKLPSTRTIVENLLKKVIWKKF